MNVFFDLEFTGLHQNTTPISIGLVADNGRDFYAEFNDYEFAQVDKLLEEHVINRLLLGDKSQPYMPPDGHVAEVCMKGNRKQVAHVLAQWLNELSSADNRRRLTLWGDVCAYDWVVFCELWGGAFHVPECVEYAPGDVSTLLMVAGVHPDVDREIFIGKSSNRKHNALHDAKVTAACFAKVAAFISGEIPIGGLLQRA